MIFSGLSKYHFINKVKCFVEQEEGTVPVPPNLLSRCMIVYYGFRDIVFKPGFRRVDLHLPPGYEAFPQIPFFMFLQ